VKMGTKRKRKTRGVRRGRLDAVSCRKHWIQVKMGTKRKRKTRGVRRGHVTEHRRQAKRSVIEIAREQRSE